VPFSVGLPVEKPTVKKRNLIGRANRWLHYQDMRRFKAKGFALYDFGGYAKDSGDVDLQRINQFKEGFRGYSSRRVTTSASRLSG